MRATLLLLLVHQAVLGAQVAAAAAPGYNATATLGNPWVGLVPYGPSAATFPHSMENFYLTMASLMAGVRLLPFRSTLVAHTASAT